MRADGMKKLKKENSSVNAVKAQKISDKARERVEKEQTKEIKKAAKRQKKADKKALRQSLAYIKALEKVQGLAQELIDGPDKLSTRMAALEKAVAKVPSTPGGIQQV